MSYPTVNDCLRLSLKRLFEVYQPNTAGGWTLYKAGWYWTTEGERKPHSSITIEKLEIFDHGTGLLNISFKKAGVDHNQSIKLVTTKPQYGGIRWWMVCPYSGKRCLYLFNGRGDYGFGSQRAFKLKYPCQNEDKWSRLRRRSRKVENKYGVPDGFDGWFPKPKGMHLRTYHKPT